MSRFTVANPGEMKLAEAPAEPDTSALAALEIAERLPPGPERDAALSELKAWAESAEGRKTLRGGNDAAH